MNDLKTRLWAFKQKTIINYFDKNIPLDGVLSKNGFYTIKKYFSNDDLSEIVKSLDLEQQKLANDVYDIKLSNPLTISKSLTKILFDKKIKNIITDYLGPNVRFDFCNAWRLRHNKFSHSSNSNYWHHDCVGHRLKIFVLLSDTDHEKGQKTFYLAGSNKNKYLTYNTFIDEEKRVPNNLIDISKLSKLHGKKGDLFIFDTNGLHKGNYEDGIHDRDVMQFEFSNKQKGKYLSGYIGPRDTFLPIDDFKNTLVDNSQIKLLNDQIRYG